MRGMPLRLAIILFALFLSAASAAADDGAALWAKLKDGNRVALVRHADAPGGAGDPPGFKLDDCATQRNLSEKGRIEAKELGARIRKQKIPVGKILVSQWCRCRETAALMDIGAAEEAATFNNAFVLRERRAALTEGARAIVAGWQGPGALVIVTHGANILPLTGIQPAEAEIVVVEPDPASDKKLRVLGRIPFGS